MNIGFITDTNIIKKNNNNLNKNNGFLDNMNFFIEYIESLKKTNSKNELIYFMPNIVMEELYYQKLRAFNKRYESLCNNFSEIKYGLEGEKPKCIIEEILNKEKEEYKGRIKILELQYSSKLFEELTADALKKNPPFDKTSEGEKTDAGYKDALIWKTVIYSKEIDKCKKIYFFSGDKIFKENEEYLTKEFNTYHPHTEIRIFYFEPDGNQRQNSLNTIIKENNLLKTDIIKLYDLNFLLKDIRNLKYKYDKKVYYFGEEEKVLENIIFKDFSNKDFKVESAKENLKKYEVIVSFETDKYRISDNSINLSVDNRKLIGYIKLNYIKNEKEFKLESYKLIKVNFYYDLSEVARKISKIFIEYSLNNFNNYINKTISNEILNNKSKQNITYFLTSEDNNLKKKEDTKEDDNEDKEKE